MSALATSGTKISRQSLSDADPTQLLVGVRLEAAALLELGELCVGGCAALFEHVQLHGAVVHLLLMVLKGRQPLSDGPWPGAALQLPAVLGPGDVLVVEVLDALIQEGMGALMHRRLHVLGIYQLFNFLASAT